MSLSGPAVIERIELRFRNLPSWADGMKIVHLSDLHLNKFVPECEQVVEAVNAENADLVALTGDFVNSGPSSPDTVCRMLAGIRSRLGGFAVLGNWEYKYIRVGRDLASELADAGFRLLVNECVPLREGEAPVCIAGIDDSIFGAPDLEHTLADAPEDAFTILLTHEPYVARLALEDSHAERCTAGKVDLFLAGHTHGGQIRLPLIWKFFLPRACGGFIGGLYKLGDARLYVNRGLGAVGLLPFRFRCPPEIAVITLRKGESECPA